jgi:glucose-1-phosphate adenylyltransferase
MTWEIAMAASLNNLTGNSLTRQTLGIILAGGKGTRLKQLTENRAKPAVPFGGKFRIIDFTLSNCVNSGIRKIGVLTQYKAHDLISHLQRGWGTMNHEFGEFVSIMPAQQQTGECWYRGTADAVYQNLRLVNDSNVERVLILGGDHIYKMDYSQLLAAHIHSRADISIASIKVPIHQASAFGVMSLDEFGYVQEFQEKPNNPAAAPGDPDHALVSMGIYVFETNVLKRLLNEDAEDEDSKHDFGFDVIPKALADGVRVGGYVFEDPECCGKENRAYWRDVGNLDQYYEAHMDLIAVHPEMNLYDDYWPIYTYHKQLAGAKFVFDDDDRRGMAIDSVVSSGCIISGSVVRRSLLSHNVRINSYSTVSECVVLPDAEVGRHCRVTKAIIGEGCKIPPRTVIGEDPIADKARFEVSDAGVVLVVQDMIDRLPSEPKQES